MEATSCTHHWLIQPATSFYSSGTCSLCGEQKDFSNVFAGDMDENQQTFLRRFKLPVPKLIHSRVLGKFGEIDG